MTKLFATFILVFIAVGLMKAQDGYVKFHTDFEFRDKTLKIFRGEIIPYFNSTKVNRINIVFGKDTISDLEKSSAKYEIVPSTVKSYKSQEHEFLQIKNGGVVWVNAISIPPADTVTLFSDKGVIVTQLINKREADVRQSDLGNFCRLVITNSPSIFYDTSLLKLYVAPATTGQTESEDASQQNNKSIGRMVWWICGLLGLVVLGAGFLVWRKYFRKKEVDSEYEVVFTGGSLKDFASQYGGLKKMISLNSYLIPNNYEKLSQNEKQNICNDLKGKRLKIRSKNDIHFGFQDSLKAIDTSNTEMRELQKDTVIQPHVNLGNNIELSGQLRQMENNLTNEIRKINLGFSSANQLNEIRSEKQELETKLTELRNDKRTIEDKLAKVEEILIGQNSKLQRSQDESNILQQEMKVLKEKVISLEFIKPYSECVYNYLKYCQQVSSDAFNLFIRISHQNPTQSFAAGHLLMKYQSAVNAIPVGDWLRTVQDIKDSGATTNRQLARSFSQIVNDDDRQKEFQRLIFSEVLTKYSSNILILAEAFKNLARFQGSAEFANEVQSTFGKHVTEIISKAKLTGLELKHVPLFESWEKYLEQVEDTGGERSIAYKNITGLEKGAIAEIISFGVKTSIGDDTKTIIILA